MQADERILSGVPDPEDLGVEPSLRPKRIDEYIGQRKIIDNLRVRPEPAAGSTRGSSSNSSPTPQARPKGALPTTKVIPA